MAKMTLGSSNIPSVERSQNIGHNVQLKTPQATENVTKEVIREVGVEHHHHHHHTQTVKTRDSRARKYIKAVKLSLQDSKAKSIKLLNTRMDIMAEHIRQLENRKPEEKQVLTVETKHIETIREISPSTSMDKRILLVIAITTALNIALILLK